MAMRQCMVPLARPAGILMVLKLPDRITEWRLGHPELSRAFIEESGGSRVGMRIPAQREIVREVRALAGKARARPGSAQTPGSK